MPSSLLQDIESLNSTVSISSIRAQFDQLTAKAPALTATTARERKLKLRALLAALLHYRTDIQEALHADFRKHPMETDLSEILTVSSEIRYVCRHLSGWMAGRPAGTPITLFGHQSAVKIQPKGVVLIIAPWNYPVNLLLIPLVSAVASGNAVVLKPSEYAPHTSAVLSRLIRSVFAPDEVLLFEGGKEIAEVLLDLPFNHIFFTGSETVGRIVMTKAAQHLSSVTLELGGKSPAIVHEDADVQMAANRIVWGKFFNAGQICISPDYVLVEESKKEALLLAMKSSIDSLYGKNVAASADYARMINMDHYKRLMGFLRQAMEEGARVHCGGECDEATRFIAPTILTEIATDNPLLTEEIFGPILPVISYKKPEDAVAFIQARPKPLALYIFSSNSKNQRYFLNNTRSGGVAINTTLVHFYNNELPFGGDNTSGIGKAHGYYGFLAFSNERAVIRQKWRWTLTDLVQPPYRRWLQKLTGMMVRWF